MSEKEPSIDEKVFGTKEQQAKTGCYGIVAETGHLGVQGQDIGQPEPNKEAE